MAKAPKEFPLPRNTFTNTDATTGKETSSKSLRNAHAEAKPNDNRIGRIDSLGVRDYAEGEGLKGEPRAIVRFHSIDNEGRVQSQNVALDQAGMRNLLTDIRREAADPNNTNPNTAQNLHVMKDTAYALNAAIETGINLGYGVTPQDLQKVTALDMMGEGLKAQAKNPPPAPSILPPGYN